MSAILKAGWLKDSQGNKFAPKTMSSQVIKDDGTLLEEKINLDLSELRQYTNDELAKKADKEHDHEITVYTHPTNAGNKHIPSGGASGQILKWSANGTAVWGDNNAMTCNVVESLPSTGTNGSLYVIK